MGGCHKRGPSLSSKVPYCTPTPILRLVNGLNNTNLHFICFYHLKDHLISFLNFLKPRLLVINCGSRAIHEAPVLPYGLIMTKSLIRLLTASWPQSHGCSLEAHPSPLLSKYSNKATSLTFCKADRPFLKRIFFSRL